MDDRDSRASPRAEAVLDFDVIVIGAGPAGLAAACAAAEQGRRVAMVDNTPWLGGQIWRGEEAQPKSPLARTWIERWRRSGATVLSRTTVFAAPSAQMLLAESPQQVVPLTWRKLVLATGAREWLLPFPGWTLPHVIGAGGFQAMVKAGWPVKDKRVVVAGSGPLLLAVADGLQQHGAHVGSINEQASWTRVVNFGLQLLEHPGKLFQGAGIKARLLGVPYRWGTWPVRAEGDPRVPSVTLTNGRKTWTERCDFLVCGFGLVPNIELAQLLGCALNRGWVTVNEHQETSRPGIFCAGEPTGIGGAECALVEGRIAGLCAAEAFPEAQSLYPQRAAWHRFRQALAEAFALRPELKSLATPDTLVCRCEDVSRARLEAQPSWRAAKLHTRCGMGPCQGRVCGSAAEFLFGWQAESVRPPLFPVRVESLASAEIPKP